MLHKFKETKEKVLMMVFKETKALYDKSPKNIRMKQEKNMHLYKILH
jgi:hypothetical protein